MIIYMRTEDYKVLVNPKKMKFFVQMKGQDVAEIEFETGRDAIIWAEEELDETSTIK